MQEDYIKLIFGLKVKQIRTNKDLSLFKLSKITGLSKSYLNEIEKGKKYPKTDKIILLAEAFDVSYDELVSLKLDKNLAPVAEILQSNLLQEIPLELFGIEERDLIEIISNAPMKVNAFISTLIEIGNNYNLTRESFYLASLRSFQEANDNYFPEIELQAKNFLKQYTLKEKGEIISNELMEEILKEEYGYEIILEDFKQHNKPELAKLRSIYIEKNKQLYINIETDKDQKRFILAKELGYNYLNFKERLNTYSWINFKNFDQLLNNFYASYFAGALLLPEDEIVEKLTGIFQNEKHNLHLFLDVLGRYTASPETVYQRMTNLLPKHFSVHDMFYLRMTSRRNSDNFKLNKELHLHQHQSPQANKTDEHYCRRWGSLNVIKQYEKQESKHVIDAQISVYPYHDNRKYYVISSATTDPFSPEHIRSVSLGILLKSGQRKIKFLNDANIPAKEVGVTCENCGILDCTDRVAPPKRYDRQISTKNMQTVVNEFIALKSK